MDVREEIRHAARLLGEGRLVAFPTETVYGLGADATNPDAVRRIFIAKGRPATHPVIVHLADAEQLSGWTRSIPSSAVSLARAFWPGPLTLILPRGPLASDVVTGGQDTVGVRVPSHPVAQALLREFGRGIAAPSANRFGRVSPTRAEHVREELGDAVDWVLDGGPCEVGLESTIVDVSGPAPSLLRPGAVTAEQLSEVLGAPLDAPSTSSPRVPGALASHYAPRARVELVTPDRIDARLAELLAAGQRVAVLTDRPLPADPRVVSIQMPADPASQARQLYDALRSVDQAECDVALVTLPAERGLGVAIADRLRRAAGGDSRGSFHGPTQ